MEVKCNHDPVSNLQKFLKNKLCDVLDSLGFSPKPPGSSCCVLANANSRSFIQNTGLCPSTSGFWSNLMEQKDKL